MVEFIFTVLAGLVLLFLIFVGTQIARERGCSQGEDDRDPICPDCPDGPFVYLCLSTSCPVHGARNRELYASQQASEEQ